MGEDRPRRCAEEGVLSGDPAEAAYGDLRLYGRRQDKPLKPRQQRLMQTLLPQLAVKPEDVADAVAEAAGGPVWLEIGFGGGEHLAWQADTHPDVLTIGAEPFVNGVGKLLGLIEERGLDNIRICHGDARRLMAAMPDGCLSKLFVLHPDPWPKRKHHKRRIVSQVFLADAARLLRPGGEMRVSSDIPDYVRWTLMQVQRANRQAPVFTWMAERQGDWLDRPEDWPQTRYEAKALREGRRPAYLRFVRN